MLHDRPRPPKLGFTLIELVVVTAFVGLLIAIILPPAQRVRRQAQSAVCANNLRQQYQAASVYAAYNNGYYPRGVMGLNDTAGEYNIYAAAILPYLGWDGDGLLWASIPTDPQWKNILKRLNGILLDFDQFHCPGFPADYYDDPNDRRYFYYNEEDEEMYGPGGDNPLHYAVSAFPMPYGQFSIDSDGSDLCWDEGALVEGFYAPSDAPYYYAESSTLESFPVNCPPASKVYVTGVDKTIPWNRLHPTAGMMVGIRYYTAFLTSQLNFGSHPRLGEDSRHPGGMNCLFFDGNIRTKRLARIDPGCEVPLNERLRLFTIPWDGWDGWGDP